MNLAWSLGLENNSLITSEMSNQKARYISNLKVAAQLREKDSDRVYERKLLKERMESEEEFKDKPKFITTAYKERLKEKQQWEYEQKYDACIICYSYIHIILSTFAKWDLADENEMTIGSLILTQ